MSVPAPHFLLYSQVLPAARQKRAAASEHEPPIRAALVDASGWYGGRWKFHLRRPDGLDVLAAEDEEPAAGSERLELLAIVRGLESLDGPSRVTLVAPSRYVQRGLEFGLAQWRENDWQWERYGRMTPVKNSDFWQRLARLLEIHSVDCRPGRLNRADDLAAPPQRQVICSRGGRRLRVDPAAGKNLKNRRTKEPKPQRSGGLAAFGSSVLRFFGHLLPRGSESLATE